MTALKNKSYLAALSIQNGKKATNQPRDSGELKLYVFTGVFNGLYTSGVAIAVARSKEHAIQILANTYMKDIELKAIRDQYLMAKYKEELNIYHKTTNMTWEEQQAQIPHTKHCLGTCEVGNLEEFITDLKNGNYEIVPLNSPYAFYMGGGD